MIADNGRFRFIDIFAPPVIAVLWLGHVVGQGARCVALRFRQRGTVPVPVAADALSEEIRKAVAEAVRAELAKLSPPPVEPTPPPKRKRAAKGSKRRRGKRADTDKVISWAREFRARNGRKPRIPEIKQVFDLPKTTAWRRCNAA